MMMMMMMMMMMTMTMTIMVYSDCCFIHLLQYLDIVTEHFNYLSMGEKN